MCVCGIFFAYFHEAPGSVSAKYVDDKVDRWCSERVCSECVCVRVTQWCSGWWSTGTNGTNGTAVLIEWEDGNLNDCVNKYIKFMVMVVQRHARIRSILTMWHYVRHVMHRNRLLMESLRKVWLFEIASWMLISNTIRTIRFERISVSLSTRISHAIYANSIIAFLSWPSNWLSREFMRKRGWTFAINFPLVFLHFLTQSFLNETTFRLGRFSTKGWRGFTRRRSKTAFGPVCHKQIAESHFEFWEESACNRHFPL